MVFFGQRKIKKIDMTNLKGHVEKKKKEHPIEICDVGARELKENLFFKKYLTVPVNVPMMYHYPGQEQAIKSLYFDKGTSNLSLERYNNLDYSNFYRKA